MVAKVALVVLCAIASAGVALEVWHELLARRADRRMRRFAEQRPLPAAREGERPLDLADELLLAVGLEVDSRWSE